MDGFIVLNRRDSIEFAISTMPEDIDLMRVYRKSQIVKAVTPMWYSQKDKKQQEQGKKGRERRAQFYRHSCRDQNAKGFPTMTRKTRA